MTPALQPFQSLFFVPIQPPVHRIGITRLQKPFLGYGMGRGALGNLEQRRTALANVRPGIMIPALEQFFLLRSGQR
jgi:hypothetical protein